MITLRDKFEIERIGWETYYDRLSPTEKIGLIKGGDAPEGYESGLRFYGAVSELVWGQLVLYEQTIPTNNEMLLERLKIIIRPEDEEIFNNEDKSSEVELSETILNTPYKLIEEAYRKFEEDRERVLFHQFNGVIYHKSDLEKTEDESDNVVDVAEGQFNKTWYWYSLTRTIAEEGILAKSMDEAYRAKCMDVLVELAFKTQRQKIEDARNAQNNNM